MMALASPFDAEFLARLGSIVVIDLMLAGDNALVIALAVRSLPKRQQLLGRLLGTAGAVLLRVILIMAALALLRIPFLQLLGGLALIWIAIKLVRPGVGEAKQVRQGSSLHSAIAIIIVADLVMSLDNVLGVAAAAHGDMRLVVFGIALSIPIVVWGSGLLARLMNRFPWIIWFGGAVLGYVAGGMILGDGAISSLLRDVTDRLNRIVQIILAILLGDGVVGSLLRGVTVPFNQIVQIVMAMAVGALGWWFAQRSGNLTSTK